MPRRRRERKPHLIKGYIHYHRKPISKGVITEDIALSKQFKELLKQKGVYLLYNQNHVYYVGIGGFGKGKTLFSRLRHWTKDKKKKNNWTHFTAFIIPVPEERKRFLKDIEAVLIRILDPPGNKNTPYIREEKSYQKQIQHIVSDQVNRIKHEIKTVKEEHKKTEQEYKNKIKQFKGFIE